MINPLQLMAALQMAVMFQVMLMAVHVAGDIWGLAGVYGSAALLGLTDVDALTVSMARCRARIRLSVWDDRFVTAMMTDPLGLESGVVRLVEYDVQWPELFIAEEQRIRDRCGTLTLGLEHIGGTSIPGMCAKPILDIAAGRPPEASIQDYVDALRQAGYEHRGERGVAGREYFRRGAPRAFHIHLVEHGGSLWRDYLAFRDYLRGHVDAAREFADVKRALAARFSRDREAYMTAKSSHVLEILRLAGAA